MSDKPITAYLEDVQWLHRFISCTPFGVTAPSTDIQRAHDIVFTLVQCAVAAEAELARLRHPAVQHVVWRAATLLEWCAESIRQAAPVPNGFPFIPELQERADQLRALARSLITDPVPSSQPEKP